MFASDNPSSHLADQFWAAMLLSLKSNVTQKKSTGVKKRKVGSGPTATHKKEEFKGLADAMRDILASHGEAADPRQRTDIVHVDGANTEQGLSLKDIQRALFRRFPTLFSHGFGVDSVRRMMVPPKRGTHAAKHYHSAVLARVGRKKNGKETARPNRHYHRSAQGLLFEFFTHFGQLSMSHDDMNIIQVGRPAVSRYHQCRKFFLQGRGFNFATHDFPSARYGIKCGGLMVLQPKGGSKSEGRERSNSA